jgi:hypothetical protein
MNSVSYEILTRIFDHLENEDLESFSSTCTFIEKAYTRYMYPNPKRDVFVAENNTSPMVYEFISVILKSNKKILIPQYIIFDKELLPCDQCGTSICCSIKKPCSRCVKFKKECTYGEFGNPKKLIKSSTNRYYCQSPFNKSHKLVCIKKEDVGKSICVKCNKLKKCWFSNVFNNCGIPNCNLQRNSDTINTLQHWSICHLHNLCEQCFRSFSNHYDVRFEKDSKWLGN